MASLLSICFLFLSLLFLSFSPASSQNPEPKTPSSTSASSIIQQVCKTTRFPDPCETSLAQSNHVPSNPSPIQVIQTAIWVSSNNLKRVQSMVKSILYASAENKNRTNVAKICIEVLNYSQYRISQADDALPQGKVKDARAWMSAALAYQYDCWSGLKNVNDTELVADTISYMDAVIGFSSNAMSMLMSYDEFGVEIDKWAPPKTERDGFWQSTEGGDSQLWSSGGVPLKLTPNVTVCKDGRNGCYKKVQEAVNAAPNNTVGGKKFVIGIKEGVYEETVRIPLEKKNVVFLGDGMGKTVITGSAHVGIPGMSTYESATVGVVGDGFMASGLTIQNKAGPDVRQAVAFRSDSDQSVLENCEFLGHQDTLYVHSLRQFYKTCRIQGSIDFIFGNAASFFEDCDILVRPRQVNPEKGEDNVITAHGRTDPAQTTGFVFHNCMINGTTDYLKLYRSNPQVHHNFLGRPWKDFSRTVFINCTIEDIVTPQGWLPWSGEFALKTLYYGEFNNSGSGSNTTQRVSWSNQIPTEQVKTYSIHNFIQGNDWIPTSGSEPTNS